MLIELFANVFKAFSDHLNNTVTPRSIEITDVKYSMTEGWNERVYDIEVIDKDQLIDAINTFANELSRKYYNGEI